MSNYITPRTDIFLILDAEVAQRTTAPVLKTGGASHLVSSNLTLGVYYKIQSRVPE